MLKTISKFAGFFLFIAIAVFTFYTVSEKLRFNAIIIHHSASSVDNYQSIARYQRHEHGWRDAAYHLIISNGSTNIPLGYLEATGRYRFLSPSIATKNFYYNLYAIHICVVGNYDNHEMPEALQVAMVDVLQQLQKKYWIANDKISFHRDCSSSTCPGRFITKAKLHQWLASKTGKCPVFLVSQHEKVIGGKEELIYSVARKVDKFGTGAIWILKNILASGEQLA